MPDDLAVLMQVVEANMRGIRTEIERIKESHENAHVELMDMFKRAFPEGDLAGHNRFHAQLMEDAKVRREMRNEILKKLAAGSVWSAVVYFGYRFIDIVKEYWHVFNK